MKKYRYEAAPLVLAFVLGRMAEESLRQSLPLSHGRFDIFFTRLLATTLLAIALTVMVLPAIVPPDKRLLGTVGEETGTESVIRFAPWPERPARPTSSARSSRRTTAKAASAAR
jgi:hypothetical protein